MYNYQKSGVKVKAKSNSRKNLIHIVLFLFIIFTGARLNEFHSLVFFDWQKLEYLTSNLRQITENMMGVDSYKQNEMFYVSNNSIFKPGDEASVNFYFYGNHKLDLELKLLKVNNPIKLFNNLSSNRRRYNFDIWGANNQFLVENSELIRKWDDTYDIRRMYHNKLKLGKIEKAGLYILQIKYKTQVAYCPILVTNYAIISKEFKSNLLAAVVDIKTGEINRGSEILLFDKMNELKMLLPDKDGIFLVQILSDDSDIQLYAKTKDEIIPFNVYSIFNNESKWNLIGYIYTNQPVYRPSQTVNFKGILRLNKGNENKNFENQICRIKISSPQNKTVYSDEITTNEFGTLNGSFILDENADLGNYTIEIIHNNERVYGNFSVEEYKKPEFKVLVQTNSNHYSFGDTISGNVSAEYYFGSKVKDATVKINVFKQHFWMPWWRGHRFGWFYDSFEKIRPFYGYGNELVEQIEGELDENGILNFSFIPQSEKEFDFKYNFVAEVTDQSRRTISGSKEVLISRGSFSISSSPEKYFYQQNEEVKIKVNISDFEQKGVETDFKLIVTYPDDKLYRPYPFRDTLTGRTNRNGIGLIMFRPKGGITGYFSYTIVAFDKKKNVISSNGSFYIGNFDDYFDAKSSNQIEIVTDKDIYQEGDTLSAIIFTPIESQQFLLTIETDEVLFHKVLVSKNNATSFEYVIKDNLAPNFNISICFINDKVFYQNSKSVGVIPDNKFLNIDIITNYAKYKPRDNVEYLIRVRKSTGMPAKNVELSFGLTDESLYDIVNEQLQPIDKFFFSPRYFYVPSNSSTSNFYYNASSRPITYLEEFYFNSNKGKTDIKFKLNYKGRFVTADSIFKHKKLRCVLIGTIKSFTTEIDSLGNFEFSNVPADKYQIFISNSNGDLQLIKEIVLTANQNEQIKISNSVLDKIYQLIEKDYEFQTQREDFLIQDRGFLLQTEAMPLQKSAKNGISKTEFVKPELRKEFADAITWLPNIYTDDEGKAKVKLKLPDNLGTWRATVRGVTKETEVGEQINKIISTKNLLIRAESPRFITIGDEITISTIVHNYLNDVKRTKIEFNAGNLELLSSEINSKLNFKNLSKVKNVYEIILPANSEIRIDWRVKSSVYKNEAIIRASALTNEESDAIELKIPVIPQGVKIQIPFTFDDNENEINKEIEFEIPSNIDLKSANLSFSVNPTLTTSLLNALEELAGYPYGCVEQTMSRFLPTLYVNNLLETQKIKISSKVIEEMPKYVETGIKRLIDFQQPDGGWGWWKNDQSNPFMTAYVLYGLNFAKQGGFNVDDFIIQSGIKNLEFQIQVLSEKDQLTKLSYMIYVYSELIKNNPSASDKKIKEKLALMTKMDLDSYSLSLIILALKNFGEINLAKSLTTKLIQQVNKQGQFAFWDKKELNFYWHNDAVQTTSYAVKALLEISPDNELINKAVRWLLLRRQGYSWNSTQTSAMVLFAITDFLKLKNELSAEYIVSVSLNGVKIYDRRFSNKDILTEQPQLKLSDADKKFLVNGKNIIRIEKSGIGSIYFSGLFTFYSSQTKSSSDFFTVERNYYLLEPLKQKDRIIFIKKNFDGVIYVGQDLLVETTIKSKQENLEYLISEDMLPAGFEVVKDLSNYQIEEKENSSNSSINYFPSYNFSNREYRDEKVVFFSTYFNKQNTFKYIIKAQIPGLYNVNPAQTYLMYYTDFNGNSDKKQIIVKDLNK